MTLGLLRLLPVFRERVWGAMTLAPWFPEQGGRIGEVWFTCNENQTAGGPTLGDLGARYGEALWGRRRPAAAPDRCPVLVKFLFTTERLSVQVHPDDAYAHARENSVGKTEMWHVLAAGPAAEVALGLVETVSAGRARQAMADGGIAQLLCWQRVRQGDTLFVPAGTVHAIGADVTVCEVQQNSDVTYRMYDYGRPRELHVDKALDVARLEPCAAAEDTVELGGGRRVLASCEHFTTERVEFEGTRWFEPDPERCHVLVMLEGAGRIGGETFRAGEVWLVPAQAERFAIEAAGPATALVTYYGAEVSGALGSVARVSGREARA